MKVSGNMESPALCWRQGLSLPRGEQLGRRGEVRGALPTLSISRPINREVGIGPFSDDGSHCEP